MERWNIHYFDKLFSQKLLDILILFCRARFVPPLCWGRPTSYTRQTLSDIGSLSQNFLRKSAFLYWEITIYITLFKLLSFVLQVRSKIFRIKIFIFIQIVIQQILLKFRNKLKSLFLWMWLYQKSENGSILKQIFSFEKSKKYIDNAFF